VFKDKSFGLADKRRLMKALMWCSGEFESSEELRCKLFKTSDPLLAS
jgi:hypothetical protein